MKKFLKISLYFILFSGVITLLGFMHLEQNEKTCWKMNVKVDRDLGFYFIDEETIREKVLDLGDPIVNSTLKEIDISKIQKTISKIASVKDAKVYTTLDGQLHIEVSQRTPIVRIINRDGSAFYLDKDFTIMPLSKTYTAKVPVFIGELNISPTCLQNDSDDLKSKEQLEDIYQIVNTVAASEFWSAQCEHFHVSSNGDYEIVPRVGSHKIILGDTNRLNRKFKKLEAFYKKTVNKVDLNRYTAINLKYKDQVVCTERAW